MSLRPVLKFEPFLLTLPPQILTHVYPGDRMNVTGFHCTNVTQEWYLNERRKLLPVSIPYNYKRGMLDQTEPSPFFSGNSMKSIFCTIACDYLNITEKGFKSAFFIIFILLLLFFVLIKKKGRE